MQKIIVGMLFFVALGTASARGTLIAYFAGNGNALDSSTSANNGAFSGNYVSGALGQAFNLASFKMTAPDIAAYSFTDFTIDFWVNSSTYSGQTFLGQDNGPGSQAKYFVSDNEFGTGTLEFHSNGAASQILTPGVIVTLTPNAWNNVAVTKSGTQYTFYVNGSEVGLPATGQATLSDSTAPLELGFAESGYGYGGSMDEVRLYNTALTASQIQALAIVPEPASISLIGAGCVMVALRRRSGNSLNQDIP